MIYGYTDMDLICTPLQHDARRIYSGALALENMTLVKLLFKKAVRPLWNLEASMFSTGKLFPNCSCGSVANPEICPGAMTGETCGHFF